MTATGPVIAPAARAGAGAAAHRAARLPGGEGGRVGGEFTGWRAYLWTEADPRPGQISDMEDLWRLKLSDVREALRKRLAERGP